jgi:hypothetical protein
MSDVDEVNYIVRSILKNYPQEKRWPPNITDQVFQAIEKNTQVYLRQYLTLIGPEGKYKDKVNQQIGKAVKEYTQLSVTHPHVPAVLSTLITSYAELG